MDHHQRSFGHLYLITGKSDDRSDRGSNPNDASGHRSATTAKLVVNAQPIPNVASGGVDLDQERTIAHFVENVRELLARQTRTSKPVFANLIEDLNGSSLTSGSRRLVVKPISLFVHSVFLALGLRVFLTEAVTDVSSTTTDESPPSDGATGEGGFSFSLRVSIAATGTLGAFSF